METRLLIAGEQVAGDGDALSVENPFTESELASVGLPSSEQVDAAIAAAREAARSWAATPAIERGEMLHEVATRMRARTDELAELMTREGGKPLIENSDEIGWTAAAFDYYAELGRNFAGRVIPAIESTQLSLVLKEPMGVVGCIVPWNYPLLLLSWKVAPALAAGNTIVAKPSELTPALDARPGRVLRAPPGRGDQHPRGRRGGRRGDRLRRARRLRRVHRLCRDGQEDRPHLRRPRGPDQPRARRQGPVHRLPRRGAGDRRRREGRRVGRIPERRPGLHLGRALLRHRAGLRRLPPGVRRLHELAGRRRPARREHRHRAARLGPPAGQGGRPGGRRRRRGRRGRHRRIERRQRHRLLLRADRRHRAPRPRPTSYGRRPSARSRRSSRSRAWTRRSSSRTGRGSGSAPTSTPRISTPSSAACAS